MQIATWNINSIKAHTDVAKTWVNEAKPDVICLQELKCEDQAFPSAVFEELGYTCATHGQKTYNGVAILSRLPMENVQRGLPGDDTDDQARFMSAVIQGDGAPVTVCCLYLPNGNPAPGPKYDYKLSWMQRLHAHAEKLLVDEEPVVITGDFNVIPTATDARNPQAFLQDALFLQQTRQTFATLKSLGYRDAVRELSPLEAGDYTFWDYQAGAWQKNNGIRIDHALLSPHAADRLVSTRIDKHVRGWEKPSDHVPVVLELS
jgi:exodeoxyribonuclease III